MTWPDLVFQVAGLLTPAAFGLGGVMLGGRLTLRRDAYERRQQFILDQLEEFYAPMLGIREQLRAKGETRLKVSEAARKIWPQLMTEARSGGVEQLQKVRAELGPKFEKIIEYNNEQLKEEIPLYGKMVDLFTTRMHLSEDSTRAHFSSLVDFLEMWERSLSGSLPLEVREQVGADEQRLHSFYADLESNFKRLQSAIKEQ